MQHLNHFALKALCQQLNERFAGGRWSQCFSQQKDEMVVLLAKDVDEAYLRIGCGADLQYIVLQDDFHRARTNTTDLFETLNGARIVSFNVRHNERIVTIELEGGRQMACKMHGGRSNVILLKDGKVERLFRKQLTDDLAFQIPEYRIYPWDRLSFDVALAAAAANDEYAALKQVYRVFDPPFIYYIKMLEQNGLTLWEAASRSLEEVDKQIYYVGEKNGKPAFLLLPLEVYQPEPFTDITLALNEFLKRTLSRQYFEGEQMRISKLTNADLTKWRHKVKSTERSIKTVAAKRPDDEVANILMANLHQIPTGADSVELDDFYTGGKIKISLKPRLSAAENAAEYYRKHKESGDELPYLEKLLVKYKDELAQAEAVEAAFAQVDSVKSLRQFVKKYPQYAEEKKAGAPDAKLPFRAFSYEGFTIWVGRNSKNNDALTFRYAGKDDLWLHAKDIPGSHVVVRMRPNTALPDNVLEYAAGMAAYFSKDRNNTLVTVTYTPRKFVRKNKHLAAGQVLVEKEKTILVPPRKPSEIGL